MTEEALHDDRYVRSRDVGTFAFANTWLSLGSFALASGLAARVIGAFPPWLGIVSARRAVGAAWQAAPTAVAVVT
jgi:hypothetical protein